MLSLAMYLVPVSCELDEIQGRSLVVGDGVGSRAELLAHTDMDRAPAYAPEFGEFAHSTTETHLDDLHD